MVFYGWAPLPLVCLASGGSFGGHLQRAKATLFTTTEKQKIRESAENTCIDSGLMTRADGKLRDGARMMLRSHVRFSRREWLPIGASTNHHRSIPLWGHPLLYHYYRGTTDLQISLTTEFSERRQIFLWIASFASFAVKVPMNIMLFVYQCMHACTPSSMLSTGFIVVGFNWMSSPAAIELESTIMDWLTKMLKLPKFFLFSGNIWLGCVAMGYL
ncbi:hypothetical protein IFM89_022693 [Coptis chinensis]|uniref:tyrosine decarboxylase n=1 Tax=Coptis chinensis TaxID=261450 RepID=A0A835H5S2_9MAGN|nr:hypothetical protein IFM89_022693 [Coptis chinensis]